MKMIRNKQILQYLMVPLMALLVLFPIVASAFHHHDEEVHVHSDESTSHIDEGPCECALCYVLVSPTLSASSQDFEAIAISGIITELPTSYQPTTYSSFEYGLKFRRGPPIQA